MDFDQVAALRGSSDARGESRRDFQEMTEAVSCGEVVPVILSGGGGSRLWPYSTSDVPKQFLPLLEGGKCLFELAIERVRDRARFAKPVVVANARHAQTCVQLLAGEADDAVLLLEPCARNTAPAIVMAAALVSELYGNDALMLVMPSDHLIEDLDEFQAAVANAECAARGGHLVTFGVRPASAETAYGYLESGDELHGIPHVNNVVRFVEKPTMDVAQDMVSGGRHLWNAGIFLFRAATILDEARAVAPDIADASQRALASAKRTGNQIIPDEQLLSNCRSESIDYAIMEHSSRIAVVPMSPGWSDLGSWDALASLFGSDVPVGPVTTVDCEGCYIRSDGVHVAALGVRDLIVVSSGERLLILPRGRSQEVKRLLSAMDPLAARQ